MPCTYVASTLDYIVHRTSEIAEKVIIVYKSVGKLCFVLSINLLKTCL